MTGHVHYTPHGCGTYATAAARTPLFGGRLPA